MLLTPPSFQKKELSQTHLVYRIEKGQHKGPFQQCRLFGEYLQTRLEPYWKTKFGKVPPTPSKEVSYDGEPFERGKHICGEVSIEKLSDWFAPELETLRLLGFKVAIYKVAQKYLTTAEYQVWFEPSRATFVKNVDCSVLEKFSSNLKLE